MPKIWLNQKLYIHSTCLEHEAIYIRAGVRGLQVRIAPEDVMTYCSAEVADVARKIEE